MLKFMQDESLFTPGSIIPLSPESGIIQPLPAQVHAVASGRYDDYRVEAVFTTKEKAEAYAAASNKHWKEKGDRFFNELYYDDTLDLDPSI